MQVRAPARRTISVPRERNQLVHAVDRATIRRGNRVPHSPRFLINTFQLVTRQALQPFHTYHHPAPFVARVAETSKGRDSNRLPHVTPGEQRSPIEPPPLAELLAIVPFTRMLGMELVSASAEEVVGRLAWREELCTMGGALHGGALMSLADNLGGLCAYLNLTAGATTATISSSTNFMRGVREGHVTGTARPLRVGRSVIVVETDIRDDAGRLAVQTTQAQAVISSR